MSEDSYWIAIGIYVGAAALIVLYLAWWLSRHWRAGWVALIALLVAALMLTPAFPREGVHTMAPALVVAGFQYFTEGYESARHAIRPLAAMCTIALVLTILLRLTLFKPPAQRARGRDR